MSNLLFLVVPAAIAAVAVTFVWWRNRPETSPTSGIDRFSGQMAALAPEDVAAATGPDSDVGIRVQPVDDDPTTAGPDVGAAPPDDAATGER